jgi:hypothetical protein
MDKDYAEFVMDMLFVSIFNDDHEDAMDEILYYITDDDQEEYDFYDIIYASGFAGMYHTPSSIEQESLDYIRKEITLRELNG